MVQISLSEFNIQLAGNYSVCIQQNSSMSKQTERREGKKVSHVSGPKLLVKKISPPINHLCKTHIHWELQADGKFRKMVIAVDY